MTYIPTKHLIFLLTLLLLLTFPATTQAQEGRYFPETGYHIESPRVWDYFQSRGGISTFGYPVSGMLSVDGLPVQIFQRHVLQVAGEEVRPLNLLDPDVMPLTEFGGLTFPRYNATLARQAPAPDTPDYGAAVVAHLEQHVPEIWETEALSFYAYYLSAAPTDAPAHLAALFALEVWGFPTSTPQRDPNNTDFIYQRFQRGIMHYDATTNTTAGILLGDAFKEMVGYAQATPPASLEDTLILTAQPQRDWALRTYPDSTLLSEPIFNRFYGYVDPFFPESLKLLLSYSQPKLSPNERFLLLPGISLNEYGDEGTGTWLVDLHTGQSQQLSSLALIATWNPQSDEITYIEGDSLYVRNINEEQPTTLFQNPELTVQFAHGSPDGKWIAVVTVSTTEKDDTYPDLFTETLSLIPTDGSTPRQLLHSYAPPGERLPAELSWSHDSQYLLRAAHSEVVNLEGERIPVGSGLRQWVPNRHQLVRQSENALQLISLDGEVETTISQIPLRQSVEQLTFSPDGNQLAYTLLTGETGQSEPFVFDLATRQTRRITTPAQGYIPHLAWSTNSQSLIIQMGTINSTIWMIPLAPNNMAVKLADGVLVATIPKP